MKEILQINIPVYQACLWVFFGPVKDCQAAMKKLKVSDRAIHEFKEQVEAVAECKGMCMFDKPDNIVLLWMPEMQERIDHYATLVHEIEHYVFRLFDRIGMVHSEDSDEAYAYLHSYLFREIDNYIVSERNKNTLG